MRHRAEPRAAGALPGQLLRRRDALHHVRHRDHLRVPVRRLPQRARAVRVRRHRHLLGAVLPDLRLRGRPRRPRLGSDAARAQPHRRRRAGQSRSARWRPPSAASAPRAGRPRKRPRGRHGSGPERPRRRPARAHPQRHHRARRGAREVGPLAQLVAGQLRARLLRHRDDGHRRRPLRHLPLRHGGLPGVAAPGRHHDRRRPREPEDGARAAPGLRPDDGAEVGHLDGRLRLHRRDVQQLRHRPGRRPGRAGRRVRARLPADARDAAPRHRDAAPADRGRRADAPPRPGGAGVHVREIPSSGQPVPVLLGSK